MKLTKSLTNLSNFVQQYRQSFVASLITLTLSLGVLGLRETGALEPLEVRGLDYLFHLRPAEKVDERIVIVEISEDDIQSTAKWPWSDQIFAQLITNISAAKPVAIGIDKYLDLSVGEGRQKLITAMKQANNVVNATILPLEGKGVDLPKDLEAVSSSGFVNILADSGSTVRRALLAVDYDAFAFVLARLYLDKKANISISFDGEKQIFSIGDRPIPRIQSNYGGYRHIDANGYQILLNYRGKPGTFKHLSAVDVLNQKFDAQILRDRIVLIGVTAISLKDSYPTPFSQGARTSEDVMYGVEVHANIVSQIISAGLNQRAFIQVWSDSGESLWIVGWIILGGTVAALIRRVSINLGILTTATLVLAISVYWAFLQAWWIPFFPAVIGLLSANILVMAYRFSQEQADRVMLMQLFSKHVSKELVEIIWQEREQLLHEGRIEGQEVYVTVLFTDMRNFSSSAEVQSPKETLIWLNEYLGAIASVVLEQGGMVDKYIGDAVMAVFGVPVPHSQESERRRDAQNAVTAALLIAEKLHDMNQVWKAKGLPEIETGIGINSGIVIAGSLGSTERLEYSVIGDAVNIAARLESFNKEVDGGQHHILISQDTCDRLEDKFKTEVVGNFALKGRAAETAVYRVIEKIRD